MVHVFEKYLVHKIHKNSLMLTISGPSLNFGLKTLHLVHIRPLPARISASFFLWDVRFGSVQRARSSAVEHFVDIEGVTGSIPVVPTT